MKLLTYMIFAGMLGACSNKPHPIDEIGYETHSDAASLSTSKNHSDLNFRWEKEYSFSNNFDINFKALTSVDAATIALVGNATTKSGDEYYAFTSTIDVETGNYLGPNFIRRMDSAYHNTGNDIVAIEGGTLYVVGRTNYKNGYVRSSSWIIPHPNGIDTYRHSDYDFPNSRTISKIQKGPGETFWALGNWNNSGDARINVQKLNSNGDSLSRVVYESHGLQTLRSAKSYANGVLLFGGGTGLVYEINEADNTIKQEYYQFGTTPALTVDSAGYIYLAYNSEAGSGILKILRSPGIPAASSLVENYKFPKGEFIYETKNIQISEDGSLWAIGKKDDKAWLANFDQTTEFYSEHISENSNDTYEDFSILADGSAVIVGHSYKGGSQISKAARVEKVPLHAVSINAGGTWTNWNVQDPVTGHNGAPEAVYNRECNVRDKRNFGSCKIFLKETSSTGYYQLFLGRSGSIAKFQVSEEGIVTLYGTPEEIAQMEKSIKVIGGKNFTFRTTAKTTKPSSSIASIDVASNDFNGTWQFQEHLVFPTVHAPRHLDDVFWDENNQFVINSTVSFYMGSKGFIPKSCIVKIFIETDGTLTPKAFSGDCDEDALTIENSPGLSEIVINPTWPG